MKTLTTAKESAKKAKADVEVMVEQLLKDMVELQSYTLVSKLS